MLTTDQIDEWYDGSPTNMLEDQVSVLRYYLDIENDKIKTIEREKRILMKGINQCRRKILKIEREEKLQQG